MPLIALQKFPELEKSLSFIEQTLGENCLASYLHGSAVVSGLKPTSDLDLLFIVKSPLDNKTRSTLITGLMSLSGAINNQEGQRALEVIIFLLDDLSSQNYPTRCEFIYGEWLRESILTADNPLAIFMPFKDHEMTLVYAQAQREAKLLNGINSLQNSPEVPFLEIRKAIQALAVILSENYHDDQRNVLLTLARMMRTLRYQDFISKDAAADWISPLLSEQSQTLLQLAKEDYLTGKPAQWSILQIEVGKTIQELRQLILKS